MSEREKELLDSAVDPPNNDGGTTATTTASLDSATAEVGRKVDPPNNDGGTGK